MEAAARTDPIDPADRFIAELYRSGLAVPPDEFRRWALERWREVLPFDGALWGSGTMRKWSFHTVTLLDLPEDFARALERTRPINPIVPRLISSFDDPVDMRSVIPDARFFGSEIHRECFEPFGISRILSLSHADPRSGVYSLLSLYRRDRRHPFSEEERLMQRRVGHHLIEAASHAFFLHLLRSHQDRPPESAAAAIDCEGLFHDTTIRFTEVLDRFYPKREPETLPFVPPVAGESLVTPEGLCVRTEALADLNILFIWPAGPLDRLTARERQIVYSVAQGLSFKQAARRIGIAPSTVANHLYRIYRKLGVYSRSELATMVYPVRPG